MSFHAELIESILDAPGAFTDVALQSPATMALVTLGALLVAVAAGAAAWLAVGAGVEFVTPPPEGRTHRPS